MKRFIFGIILFSCTYGYCEHTTATNASNLTKGTLSNARLDPSSVTLGASSLNNLVITPSSMSSIGTITSTVGFVGNGSGLYNIPNPSTATSIITIGSMTSYGTVMSTAGFVGDGSKLTGITTTASTTNIIIDLVMSTSSTNANLVVASATAIDIMGCFYTNFSSYVDLSLAGAGGIPSDDAVDRANTWYSIWAISNSGCTSSGMIGSTYVNSISPRNMPSGFTKYRLLTYVRNDGSANVIPFWKNGNDYAFVSRQTILNSGTPSSNLVNIDATAVISTAATTAHFHSEGIGSAATLIVQLGSSCNTGLNNLRMMSAGSSMANIASQISIPLCFDNPGTVRYQTANVATNIEFTVIGFTERIP